jgi:hypothetical protein
MQEERTGKSPVLLILADCGSKKFAGKMLTRIPFAV